MISEVELFCRECDMGPVHMASGFEPNEGTEVEDMQAHMDVMFVARCQSCFACDWEVTSVKAYHKPASPILEVVDGAH